MPFCPNLTLTLSSFSSAWRGIGSRYLTIQLSLREPDLHPDDREQWLLRECSHIQEQRRRHLSNESADDREQQLVRECSCRRQLTAVEQGQAREVVLAQLGCGGHVINLPQNVVSFISSLPRHPNSLTVIISRKENSRSYLLSQHLDSTLANCIYLAKGLLANFHLISLSLKRMR